MSAATAPSPGDAEPTELLSRESRFEGHVAFQGQARLDGRVIGRVSGRGALWVGAHAQIEGSIAVDRLVVEGGVHGEIVAREAVELRPGARVSGTLRTPVLAVEEGALLEAELAVGGAPGGSRPAGS